MKAPLHPLYAMLEKDSPVTVITEIPPGFTPHTDDSSKYGYPPGVHHHTVVECVIEHAGVKTLHGPTPALNFGWAVEPHRPSSPGLSPCAAPITHYRVVSRVCHVCGRAYIPSESDRARIKDDQITLHTCDGCPAF